MTKEKEYLSRNPQCQDLRDAIVDIALGIERLITDITRPIQQQSHSAVTTSGFSSQTTSSVPQDSSSPTFSEAQKKAIVESIGPAIISKIDDIISKHRPIAQLGLNSSALAEAAYDFLDSIAAEVVNKMCGEGVARQLQAFVVTRLRHTSVETDHNDDDPSSATSLPSSSQPQYTTDHNSANTPFDVSSRMLDANNNAATSSSSTLAPTPSHPDSRDAAATNLEYHGTTTTTCIGENTEHDSTSTLY